MKLFLCCNHCCLKTRWFDFRSCHSTISASKIRLVSVVLHGFYQFTVKPFLFATRSKKLIWSYRCFVIVIEEWWFGSSRLWQKELHIYFRTWVNRCIAGCQCQVRPCWANFFWYPRFHGAKNKFKQGFQWPSVFKKCFTVMMKRSRDIQEVFFKNKFWSNFSMFLTVHK